MKGHFITERLRFAIESQGTDLVTSQSLYEQLTDQRYFQRTEISCPLSLQNAQKSRIGLRKANIIDTCSLKIVQ